MRDLNGAAEEVGRNGVLLREFQWTFAPAEPASRGGRRLLSGTMSIEQAEFEASHRARPRGADVHVWGAFAGARSAVIDRLALQLHHQLDGLTLRDRADAVLTFVQQSIRYTPDPRGLLHRRELVRCPVETLVGGEGDCEDLAILAAALLWRLEFTVALLFLPTVRGRHCAVGVAELSGADGGACVDDHYVGRSYGYGETTEPGYRFGQAPAEFDVARASPVAVTPHTWDIDPIL